MTIGIDGNEANVVQAVGVSVYTQKLLEHFHSVANENLRFVVYLRDNPLPHLPVKKDYFDYVVAGPRFLWSQLSLPLALIVRKKPDVFFSPAHYAPRFSPVSTVVTIHDLSYFYFSDEFLKKDLHKLTHWTRYSVEKASRVICVSKTTKRDLLKFYNVDEERVSVIYNGFEKSIKTTSPLGNWKLGIGNYILYVGTLQPRKNITTLIKAFSYFKPQHKGMKLVIAGKKGWMYEEIFDLVSSFGLEKDVIFAGHVSDVELARLYKNAFCFVLPSFYEGFGIPLLEAMSYSIPTIASRTAALMEIGEEASLYFDPSSEHELLKRLEMLYKDKKLQKFLIEKGHRQIKSFSWKKCAEETLEIIKSAV